MANVARARRPRCIDERVMNDLLHIIDHLERPLIDLEVQHVLRPLAHQAAMDGTNGVLDISLKSRKDC
jgi:hypothetical protein